jgi:hypothetical protein
MVTHDTELAREFAKTIYSVKDGHVDSLEKKIDGKWKKMDPKKC